MGEHPCLIHAGKEKRYPVLHGKSLRYIVFSHVEANESGASNRWLADYPESIVVCNKVANIYLEDHHIRPAKILADGESIDLGKRKLTLINPPHFPHNWDAHMWYGPVGKILFSSDFCCQGGICEPVVETDVSEKIISFYVKGGFIPYGKTTNDSLAIS